MTISKGEWESIYSAISQASGRSELTEGNVIGHHDDGVNVFVEGFGSEPVATVSLEYGQAVYTGGTKKTISAVAQRPAIGQRVLVARPGGSTHNPRIIGIVQTGEWKQPEDIQLPQFATGMGMIWYTNTPPLGWLICNGDPIPAQFTALIALLGANLPDMRQRVPVGRDPAEDPLFSTILGAGGEAFVTLTEGQLASHDHEFDGVPMTDHAHEYSANATSVTSSVAAPAFMAQRQAASGGTAGTRSTDGVTGPALVPTGTVGVAGFDQAHNNLQPYRIVNFIVKT